MTIELNAGDVLCSRYQVNALIGEGGMQFVYKAHDRTMDRFVALKTPKNNSSEKRFQRSATLSAKVTHPCVAKTLDYFEENGSQFLVEELIEGADLQTAIMRRLRYVDPFLAAKIIHSLAKGFAASHHVGVVHRDIKPSNIMVAGSYCITALKVTDFGIAKMAEEELADAVVGGEETITGSKTMIGALPYMAPEMVENPRAAGAPSDVWAIGALLFELLSGEKPYGTGLRAVPNILAADPPQKPDFLSKNPQFSPLANELFDIVLACLAKEPDERLTADGLVQRCNQLCYYDARRRVGYVNNTFYSHGFITEDSTDERVFYHFNNVYGDLPEMYDRVCFSAFTGGGSDRAYPVVLMTEDEDAF
ncbi:serine/threonine-protein kinase [Oceanidesulfovibrio marinus]|uniref:Serine/threonine protein kinase n=1 Tax=Oceanidesulfovibrio marinus TaxID=370038 RepID=A0ABX6NGU4_9BACT|nr:serine/threonine-protein kinase [Oceanidesulfovibrio marinus]QJT09501.1 serine/threonine protein kinase [Oceanidesulfovibrio marinus]